MAEYRLNKWGQVVDGVTGDVLKSEDVPDHVRQRLHSGSAVMYTGDHAQRRAHATMNELSKRIKNA